MKPDEIALLIAVAEGHRSGESPGVAAIRIGMKPRRAKRFFIQWGDRGWFNWSKCPSKGWLTPLGLTVAKPGQDRPKGLVFGVKNSGG